MRALFIAVLLSLSVARAGHAQDSLTLHNPFSVFILPCQLISGTYASGITAGTEFRLYRHWSASLEGGPYFHTGYMAKVNLKYYLPVVLDQNREKAWYGAIEYAYKQQAYSVTDQQTSPPQSDVKYDVRKHANTINLKIGVVLSRKGSFFMDTYAGLGMRYRVVTNDLYPGETDDFFHWHEGMIDQQSNAVADGWVPNIVIGWKIGYRYK